MSRSSSLFKKRSPKWRSRPEIRSSFSRDRELNIVFASEVKKETKKKLATEIFVTWSNRSE